MSASIPKFAVVGHPNKGKSSVVATLARDESVAIGPEPGTTQRADRYPLTLKGEVLYELIDTPGFQRAREVLEWLRAHETDSAQRPNTVRAFLDLAENRAKYPDECEILRPIVDGAAILYVVDGSVPFTEEYEAELEILRWTGSPRMGLVNPISNRAYVEPWVQGLGQFCNVVRIFNPVQANFASRVELLEAFATLCQPWRPAIERAIAALGRDRTLAYEGAISEIIDLLVETIGMTLEEPLSAKSSPQQQTDILVEKLKETISKREQRSRATIEGMYHYQRLQRDEEPLAALDTSDLFAKETWKLLGLSRKELIRLAAVAGAATGGVFDLALGGASLALGAISGGLLGVGVTWFFGERLVDARVMRLPLGRRVLRVGPVTNRQFAFVLLNRARLHHNLLAHRTHASGSTFSLPSLREQYLAPLSMEESMNLERALLAITKGNFTTSNRTQLKLLIEKITQRDLIHFEQQVTTN